MDDVRWQIIPADRRSEAEDRLLEHLGKTRAFLFAIGESVDNAEGSGILRRWSAAGHCIGNHTYSHQPLFGKITPEEFEADILRNEDVLRAYPGFRKWFRFPALNEGQTREVRDRFRSFLAQHGYRNGAVTIDASDWYYNQRMLARLEAERGFDVLSAALPGPYLGSRAVLRPALARRAGAQRAAHAPDPLQPAEFFFPGRPAGDVPLQRVGCYRRGRSVFG